MFVVTADQRGSRTGEDRVVGVLRTLNGRRHAAGRERPFERTAGDEIQGLLSDPGQVVAIALGLIRDGHWSVGLGAGEVRRPLPPTARAGSGPAYERARLAVARAKGTGDRIALEGAEPAAAERAEALLAMLSAVVRRRSAAGWEAVDLVAGGVSQGEAAERLGISKQALSRRLRVGLWPHEARLRPLAASLLEAADADRAGAP